MSASSSVRRSPDAIFEKHTGHSSHADCLRFGICSEIQHEDLKKVSDSLNDDDKLEFYEIAERAKAEKCYAYSVLSLGLQAFERAMQNDQ